MIFPKNVLHCIHSHMIFVADLNVVPFVTKFSFSNPVLLKCFSLRVDSDMSERCIEP
jgi:hypothetical protein